MRPLPFTIWFRGRYYFFLLQSLIFGRKLLNEDSNQNIEGHEYNKKQLESVKEQLEKNKNIKKIDINYI